MPQGTQQEIVWLQWACFYIKNKHKLRALGQLPIPKCLPRANSVTCLAGWQSLLRCKWRGTSHRRCHWRRGHQNQTKPAQLHTSVPPTHQHCSWSSVCSTDHCSHCRFGTHLLFWTLPFHKPLPHQDFPLPPLIIIKMGKEHILLNCFCQSSHGFIIFWNNLGENQRKQMVNFSHEKFLYFPWQINNLNCYKTLAEFFHFLSSTINTTPNIVNVYREFEHKENIILYYFMQLKSIIPCSVCKFFCRRRNICSTCVFLGTAASLLCH